MKTPTQRLMTIHLARAQKRTEDLLSVLANTKAELTGTIARIEDIQRRQYTPWIVLLKQRGEAWICLGVFNSDTVQEDEIPEGWDLMLPVPDPNTIAEFTGF